ncbi:MAG: hypothetical protein ACFFCD_08440 [Promethearchaeota archaeon]
MIDHHSALKDRDTFGFSPYGDNHWAGHRPITAPFHLNVERRLYP